MKEDEKTPVDPTIIAVIAAALAAVFDAPHKVLAVQPVTVPTPLLNVWAFEGRIELTMSHRIR